MGKNGNRGKHGNSRPPPSPGRGKGVPDVSPFERKEMLAKRLTGETVNAIAETVDRNPKTVAKVLSEPEMVEAMEELGEDVVPKLRSKLRGIAYRHLKKLEAWAEIDPNLLWKIYRGTGAAVYSEDVALKHSLDEFSGWSREEKLFYAQHGHRMGEPCACKPPK